MTLSKIMSEDIHQLVNNLQNLTKKKFLKLLKEIIMADDPSIRTQTSRYSQAKNITRKSIENEDFLINIKPDEGITKKAREMNSTYMDNKKITTIHAEQLQFLMKYRNSHNPDELALYLMLTSGRRLKELCERDFKNIKHSKNKIHIHGVSKRSDPKQFFEIQLLDSKTIFLKSLKEMKKKIKNKKYGSFQKAVMRKMKKVLRHEFHPHMLRRIYAMYLFTFRNSKNININAFVQKVLKQQTIGSSIYYTTIKFDFDSDIFGKKKRKPKK